MPLLTVELLCARIWKKNASMDPWIAETERSQRWSNGKLFYRTTRLCGEFQRSPTWLPAVIVKPMGIQSFQTRSYNGRLQRRHVEHIHRRQENRGAHDMEEETSPFMSYLNAETANKPPALRQPEPRGKEITIINNTADGPTTSDSKTRFCSRIKQPAHFQDYVLSFNTKRRN